jgi:hypothetical protein
MGLRGLSLLGFHGALGRRQVCVPIVMDDGSLSERRIFNELNCYCCPIFYFYFFFFFAKGMNDFVCLDYL